MSDFKAKMNKIRFQLGLCPRPHRGPYSALPDAIAVFTGPTSKWRKGEEGGKGKGGKGKRGRRGREGRGGEGREEE